MKMKKLILIPMIFVLVVSFAQEGNWQTQATEFSENLYGLSFSVTDSLSGWICGENGLMLHTTDGEYWVQQPTPVTVDLFDVFFLDSLKGWSCGDSGIIINTNNGGLNWIVQEDFYSDYTYKSIELTLFNGSIYGYCVGNNIGVSTSDGQLWLGTTSLNIIHDVTFWDPYNGFRGCFLINNEMQCTQDYGMTWEYVGLFEFMQYGIIRKDQPFSWIWNTWTVGVRGTVYYNHYPGNFYPFLQAQTPDTLDLFEGDVDEIDSTIWAVGELGEIIYSTDFGVSYLKYPSPTTKNLYDVEFPGKTTGYAVGDSGTLLRYTGEWIITDIQEEQNIRDEIKILISPNPFTENVSINIRMLHDEDLQITVYDLKGMVVKNLFTGVIKTGSIEIFWDGINNASQRVLNGIYLIKILSGKNIITCKLIKK